MRQWIGRMHERFKSYPYLYSGRYFEPTRPQLTHADPIQQCIFYFGLATMIVAFPITVPLVFYFMRKVPR